MTADFETDIETWYKIAHNVILAFIDEMPEHETTVEVAAELMVGYQTDGRITYDTMRDAAALLDPSAFNDEAVVGNFAWIVDEAIASFKG